MASHARSVAVFLFVCFLLTSTVFAATVLTGTVHDAAGRPVRDVTITIAGAAAKVVTENDGAFRIQLPEGSAKTRLLLECAGFYSLHS